MKKTIALGLGLISVFCLWAQPKKVLFLGNSYTSVNNLPQLIQNVGYSFGDSIVFNQNTPGGYQFVQHVSNATTLSKIKAQDWDFVVLQEQSQKPSFPPAQVQTDVYPYAKQLNDSIKANFSCTETVFYMTWGRKNGDAQNCAFYTPLCTYAGMQQRLRESYMEMADSNLSTVAPVGVAWKNVRDSFPTIELYQVDESHPSIHGSYLAACVFYATIFQKSAVGSTYVPAGISASDALILQTVASNTVLDSMELWRINANLPVADFGFSGGNSINFTSTSTNGMYYYWDFDDGNNSVLEHPNHTYNTNGNYNVELIVFSQDSCFSDTISKLVSVTTVGLNKSEQGAKVKIFPNPAKDQLKVMANQENLTFRLIDIYGNILKEQKEEVIDLTAYASGLYFIVVLKDGEMIARNKVIKE
ncbi:MAG: DUF4886 domain-containing protein [Flavobacteriales bacterium]|nr:DUF4886 domain-containing protein [Flavobacteriales bacterium]